jgi:tetratricopeptide (TPR) repeat protein
VAIEGPTFRGVLTAAATLLALVLIAHFPALSAGWIWDDDSYVTANPALVAPDGWNRIWIPGGTPQWYPLVFASFRIEHALWGLEPFGYHLVNLLLHAGACLALWALLGRLAFPAPLLAAAILAVHPMTVESVAWVTERKNTLGLLLALLSTLVFAGWASRAARGERDPGRWWWAFGLFVAALLSKSVAAATVPALVMILLWRREATRRTLLAIVPFLVLGVAAGLHTAWLERELVGAEGGEFDLGPLERLLLAARSFAFYLATFVAPVDLAFIYPREEVRIGDLRPWASLAADLTLLVGAIVAWRKGSRGPLAILVIYAAGVFPALGFLNVYPFRYSFVADHFAHFALPALAAGVAWAGWRATATLAPRVRVALAAAACGLLATVAATHATAFRDEETLWRRTLATNPEAWMPANNLAGIVLRQAGDAAAAGDAEAATRLAGEAEELAGRAIRLSPLQFTAWSNLSEAQRLQGRRDEAEAAVDRALKLAPGVAGFRWMRARLREQAGNLEGAIEDYRAAAEGPDGERGVSKVGPDARERAVDLGRVLAVAGRDAEAAEVWRGLHAADPRDATVAGNLGLALERTGDLAGARAALQAAVANAPDERFRVRIAPSFVRVHLAAPRDAESADAALVMARWLVDRTGRGEPFSLLLLAESLAAGGDRTAARAALDEARPLVAKVPEAVRPALEESLRRFESEVGQTPLQTP